MNVDGFNEIVEARIARTRELLVTKGAEYARGEDRLHNFKNGSRFQRCTLLRDCLGKLTKHMTSIVDLIEDHEKDGKLAPESVWAEKIGDAVTYLHILEACVAELRGGGR